jgi:hypothetical protein
MVASDRIIWHIPDQMNSLSHSDAELQVLAELAERNDLQVRAEQIQAQAHTAEQELAKAEAQNRFDAIRRQYPHATPEQICSMAYGEHGRFVNANAVQINAIQT